MCEIVNLLAPDFNCNSFTNDFMDLKPEAPYLIFIKCTLVRPIINNKIRLVTMMSSPESPTDFYQRPSGPLYALIDSM